MCYKFGMAEQWNPMITAPKDGTVIDVRYVSKADGELIFRTRWLDPRRAWVDWDRQHVALTKLYLCGWRLSENQFRPWTASEEATLAEIHGPEATTYLDFKAFDYGVRIPVRPPARIHRR
jgi:hypothetical protein